MFSWNKVIFSVIIILLYIPLVFMGANIFFPKYNYQDNLMYKDCYGPRAVPIEQADKTASAEFEKCQQEEQRKQMEFQKEKNAYDEWKNLAIVFFILFMLLLLLLIKFIKKRET